MLALLLAIPEEKLLMLEVLLKSSQAPGIIQALFRIVGWNGTGAICSASPWTPRCTSDHSLPTWPWC